MTVDDVVKDKPATKQKVYIPSYKEMKEKAEALSMKGEPDVIGPYAKQTEEARLKEEQWQQKNAFQKFGAGAKAGGLGMASGVESFIGEMLPLLSSASGMAGWQPDAYIASKVLQNKARETLANRKEIYGHGTMFEFGTMAPLLAGIVASGGAGVAGAGLAASLIGEGTLVAMTMDVYGNSILEQELYQEETGKEISELQKQAVALASAAAMLVAGKVVGSGVKGVNKILGESISATLKESPDIATNILRRYIADTPAAVQKIGRLAWETSKEAGKSGLIFGAMTTAQDILANLNKYPEDRLLFEEVVTNTLQSIKMGGMLGAFLGPFAAGQSEVYHYMRRKKSGFNIIQTKDGQTYEKVSDHPLDPTKVTVLDRKMNIKDINREDIVDQVSMTAPEKEQLLDAWKTNQDALPEIEKAILTNNTRRVLTDLTNRVAEIHPKTGQPVSVNMMTDKDGNGYFRKVTKEMGDGTYAMMSKIERSPDGSMTVNDIMVKILDREGNPANGWRTDKTLTPEEFIQMGVDAYRGKKGWIPGVPGQEPIVDAKTGEPVDPVIRQANQDAANKVAKVGDEIKYMGRDWEVQEVGFDGSIKITGLKDGEYTGEEMSIPPEKISEVNKDIKEPEVEMVKVDGVEQAAHQGPPSYEKDGNSVSKGYIRGAIRTAKSPKDLYGLKWENDEELNQMYKAKFPEMVQTYMIGKDEVERDEVLGAINHASDPAGLTDIKINLDTELQGMLDAKLASLGVVPEVAPVEGETVTEKGSEKPQKAPEKKPAPEKEITQAPSKPAPEEKKPAIDQEGLKSRHQTFANWFELQYPQYKNDYKLNTFVDGDVYIHVPGTAIHIKESEMPDEDLMNKRLKNKNITEKERLEIQNELNLLNQAKEVGQPETEVVSGSGKTDIGEFTVESLNKRAIQYGLISRDRGTDVIDIILNGMETGLAPDIAKIPKKEWDQLRLDAFDIRNNLSRRIEGKETAPAEAPASTKPEKAPEVVEGGRKTADKISTELTEAGNEVEPRPTEAQIEAGNYPKGHISILGMNISIETAAGGIRSGTDPSGKKWSIMMNHDYGHILGTVSTDGEPVDVFIGKIEPGQKVYIISQLKPETGEFDELKIMLGFNSEFDARAGYLSNYEPGWKGLGEITTMRLLDFKEIVFTKNRTQRPIATAGWKEIDGKYINKEWLSNEKTYGKAEPIVSTEGITSPGIDITKKEFAVLDITKGLKSAYRRQYLDKLGIDEAEYAAIKESLYKKKLLLANGGIEGIGRAVVAGLYKRAGGNAISGDAYRDPNSKVWKLWDTQLKTDEQGQTEKPIQPDITPEGEFAGDIVPGGTETGIGGTEAQGEPEPAKPQFAGEKVKYTPFDEWDKSLIKARDYARHIFSTEELDALQASGDLVWNNTESIVSVINKKLSEVEPEVTVEKPKPAFAGEVVTVKKETKSVVTKKLDKQSAIKEDKIFKEQKNQLLDDLIAAEDLLLGSNKEKVRTKEQELRKEPEIDESTVDGYIVSEYEYKLDSLPKKIEAKLNKLGIKVNDGKLIIDIYKDGTVEVGDIRTALRIVDKGFPTRLKEKKYTTGPGKIGKSQYWDKAVSYGSLKESERRVALAEENLSNAVKNGNKGLQKVMEEQLAEVRAIHEVAKNVDYERLAKQDKINADVEFNALWEKNAQQYDFDNVRKEELFDILEKEGRPTELTYESVQPLVLRTHLVKEEKTVKEKIIESNTKLHELNLELSEKFSRKDGKGLKLPKTQSETFTLRSLQNQIRHLEHEIADLKRYEPEINKLSEEPAVPKEEKPVTEALKVETPVKELPTTKDKIKFTRGGREWTADVEHVFPDGKVQVDVFGRKIVNPGEYIIVGKEMPVDGIIFKNKVYKSMDQVLEAIDKGEIGFDESKQLREDISKVEDIPKVQGPVPEFAGNAVEPNPIAEIQELPPAEKEDEPTIEREVEQLEDPEDAPEDKPMTEKDAKDEKVDFDEADQIIEKVGPITDFGEKIGGARKDEAESGFTRGSKEKKEKVPAWMSGFTILTELDKFRPIKAHGQFIIWKSKDVFDSEAEAIDRIKLVVVGSKFKIGKVGEKGDDTYHVYRRVTDRKRYSLKGGFADEKEAMKWLIENQEYLLNYKPSFPVRPHIENLERTGTVYRPNNENITTDQFRETFGFTGGEFGNWVPQDERQRILNMAYDGLMDLARVLNVPPRALSLNGQLSIAFGKRGQGLQGASAHYEPARAVFNLTRMKGAGAVAHEWFHTLDHYFGRLAEGLPGEKTPGEQYEKRGIFLSDTVNYRMKGVRDELKNSFNTLLEGIFKQPKIIEVSIEHYAKTVKRYEDNLNYYLTGARQSIERGKWYGNKTKPGATPEQLKQWDDLAAKIQAGDYGEPVQYETKEKGWKGSVVTRDSFTNIIALDEIAKKVLGRSFLTKNSNLATVSQTARFTIGAKEQLARYEIDNKEERDTPTRFYYDAKDLDKLRVSDYWTTNPEMLARAFEAFVEDQISKRGNVSQYLVHSTDNENYKDPLFGDQRPYPEAAEREKFNELFQKFFDVMMSEEKGGKTILYKRDVPPIWDNPNYPKYNFENKGWAGDELDVMFEHEMMRRARIMTDHTGVPIIVVRTKNDLPERIKADMIRRFGKVEDAGVPALYDKVTNTVYAVLEDTRTITNFVSNMAHEIIAHHGLPALLGNEAYINVLQLTYRGMSPVDIINISENWNVPESDWKTIAEEYIGEMAGNGQMNPNLWQRILSKIREWIRKLFNISMSKAEIMNLLRKSRENLQKNKPEYQNAGEYLDALTAYTAKPEQAKGKFGYGIHVGEAKVITESVSKGNLDYRTYFTVAESVIGEKPSGWIEKALISSNFNYEEALDYLDTKMVQYFKSGKQYDMVRAARNYLESSPPKNPEGLYKVLVGKGKSPEELNFLSWEDSVELNQQESIMNQLDIEGKYDYSIQNAFKSGKDLYNKAVKIFGSDREASLFLSRAGIDGMAHSESNLGPFGTTHGDKQYVIYDNTPVEIINEIRYKRSQKPKFVGDHLTTAGERYTDKSITKRNWSETMQGIREYFQDMVLPVRRFEEEIIRRGGLQPNDAKPYRDISLSFGRQETLYKDFLNTKMNPVKQTITKITKTGMPVENVLPYIISKHAIERNMVFRARELEEFENRPTPNDPTQDEIDEFMDSIADKDYSGVMAFDVNNEFTNPDVLAQTIVDEFEAAVPKSLTDELWNNTRNASSEILSIWEAGQQISPEQKQEYLDRFKYFVPLRGWRDGAGADLVYTKGEGFSKSLMHAEGRKSLAENPLAYMLSTTFQAIGEQVDNEVKTSMLNLLMRNLTGASLYDLATVKKLYYVRIDLPDGTYEYEPTIERPAPDLWDEPGRVTTRIYREHQKLRSPKQTREHEVTVRRRAGDVVMVFKGKMLPVAQSMNKRNFMYHNIFGQVKDARIMNKAFTGLSHVNNFLKATYTSFNIVFPLTNFMRDLQEASITQLIKGEAGHKVIVNYHRSFPSIIRFLRGKLDMNNPDDVKLRDFYMTGGATGFTHLKSAEDLEKELMSEINRMIGRGTVRGEIKHYAKQVVEIISMWNQVFEDATRFSVYLTSIDLGKSKEDAASDAKEASINFNRKGKSSKFYDSIYAFWNVALQSLQKNFKLFKDYSKAFGAVAASFMAFGFLEALMNHATDDEDPENDYYNINPWMRENYLILPNLPKIISGESKGDKYLSIPLPQFWRGFKSIGSLAYDLTQDKVTVGKAISQSLLNFGASLSPVDPGGFVRDGEFSLAPMVPTVFKPFYEIATNHNYMGYTIAREPFDKAQKKLLANARLGKDNVNPAAKFFTDMLFRWGGGDNASKYYISKSGEEKKVPGFLDINPSFIEHLFKGYTGGTGMVFSDLITTISQVLKSDEEINFKNVPFVNRFIRQTPEEKWNIISEYYNLKDVVAIHKGLKRQYTKQAEAGGDTSQIEKTEGSGYYESYQSILDNYDNDISEMSKEIDFSDIEGSVQIYELMKQCINDIDSLKKEFNK